MYCKEIKPVNPIGNQSWIFIGRTDAEAEAPIFWPPDAKCWLIWKDPDAGKNWGQRRRGWQRTRWLDDITDSVDMNLSKLFEKVKARVAWLAIVHGVARSWIWLRDWTTILTRNSMTKMKLTNFLKDITYQNSPTKIDHLNRPASVKEIESIIT